MPKTIQQNTVREIYLTKHPENHRKMIAGYIECHGCGTFVYKGRNECYDCGDQIP